MSPLRVLSANIQSGRSATGEQTTAVELAAAFEHLEADVVALQEVDRDQPRSGRLDQVRIIADALGLPHHRFAAALAGDVRSVRDGRQMAEPIVDHPGPAYGVALLSRYPVVGWFATRLPQLVRRLPTWRGTRPGWWVHEPRVGLAAILAGPDGPFAMASTHLSLLPPVARRQLRTLLAGVEGLAGAGAAGDGAAEGAAAERSGRGRRLQRAAPLASAGGPATSGGLPATPAVLPATPGGLAGRMIVAGDFNLGDSTVAKDTPGWDRPEALTFHADHPFRQIDHILVRGGRTAGARAHRLAIADHRALATEVHWT